MRVQDVTIALGRYVATPTEGADGLRVLCDAPELERHAHRAWFRAYAAERLDFPLPGAGEGPPHGQARVGADLLARHACLVGATGSGKTRLALRLLAEQLRAGGSVVMLDPKAETLRHLLILAHAAGLPPERVTILSPSLAGAGAPGWNPLGGGASGLSPPQAAADFVSVLARGAGSSWGPRLQDVLTNALLVIAAHGLSLFELVRLLQREDYREALLRQGLPRGAQAGRASCDPATYVEARDYFQHEFAGWSKSEKASAVAPVLNKLREFLRNPFLRALLCARRTTLDLASLWQSPGLVLVHLDGPGLGDEGARLLGGLLAHTLLRTAFRTGGPTPVVLALDEAGVAERLLGGTLADTLALARSRNLRLLLACQHLDQLSDPLRRALLANAAVQAFFRLGPTDARLVAASLAAGTGERVSAISADVAKRDADGLPETWAEVSHTIRDGRGDPVRLSAPAWAALRRLSSQQPEPKQVWEDPARALGRLAGVSGVGRLYVLAADTKQPVELGQYVAGLGPGEYAVVGPAPARLVVTFPRPRLSVVSRLTEAERERGWVKALASLPVRHAVLRLAGGVPGMVRVADVPDPFPSLGLERFLSAAVARSGQTAREVERALEWRREQVERVANGGEAPPADPPSPALPRHRNGRGPKGREAPEHESAADTRALVGTVAEDGSLA